MPNGNPQRGEAVGRRQASVLVGLLWCLALLSVVVVGVLHTGRMDLITARNYRDGIQAHYLALAGVEKAKALLYLDARNRRRNGKNHTGELDHAPGEFRDVALGRGHFRVFHQGRRDEGGDVRYGVSDEESRLNVNTATAEELGKLPRMTPPIAAAIVDWRDEDNRLTPGGAEAEYYTALRPPRLPRNGPFQTVRELLMAKGVSPEFFLGEDTNQNGLLDPEEDDGNTSYPADNRDGVLDAGWSGVVTVDSGVRNVNAAGETRVNIQSGAETALAGVQGISSDLARAIVAYRGQKRLESLADLLDVTRVNPQNQAARPPGPGGGGGAPPPAPAAASPNASGEKLISEDLLMDVADDLTADDGAEGSGAVNINTAGAEVLACLPGLDAPLAQAIVSHRQSSGYFPNIAWLLKVPGLTREKFKQLAPKVTARSETFRVLSEGKAGATGARQRIQAILRVSSSEVVVLSYREDL